MKKVNETQIAQLYEFTRAHFVEHYDVQTELVDHLANGIEQQWEQDPSIDFEKALNVEFKKFGIFGFSDLVDQRVQFLQKKYNKIIFTHLRDFFSLPKIILTITAVFWLTFSLMKFDVLKVALQLIIWTLFIITFIVYAVQSSKYNKRVKERGKKLLFEEMLNKMGGGPVLFIIPLHLTHLFFNVESNNWFINGLYSLIIVSTILMLYVAVFVIPKKSKEYLKEHYPELLLIS